MSLDALQSRLLRKHLVQEEELRNDVYEDGTGNLTAGVGHKLSKDELQVYKEGDIIPKSLIAIWYYQDVHKADVAARAFAGKKWDDLSPGAQTALTSVAFNWGKLATGAPKAKAGLMAGKMDVMVKEIFSPQHGVVKGRPIDKKTGEKLPMQVIDGLVNRREADFLHWLEVDKQFKQQVQNAQTQAQAGPPRP